MRQIRKNIRKKEKGQTGETDNSTDLWRMCYFREDPCKVKHLLLIGFLRVLSEITAAMKYTALDFSLPHFLQASVLMSLYYQGLSCLQTMKQPPPCTLPPSTLALLTYPTYISALAELSTMAHTK